ncbi:MAG: hypothetical protein RLY70_2373 [Planctomycetota bacterium]
MKHNSTMKRILALLTVLLLTSLAALHAADELMAKTNPDQSAGIAPDDGPSARIGVAARAS